MSDGHLVYMFSGAEVGARLGGTEWTEWSSVRILASGRVLGPLDDLAS